MINVIYDNRHSEDYERLIKEFNEQGCCYKFWEAEVYAHSVVESISASFKKIITWAKQNEMDEVIIAEQDLFFTSPNSWKYFLENKPKEFDVYIGGSYLIDNRNEYKAPLVKVNEWVGNHLIIVNKRYYDTWLNTNSKLHCDTAQSGLGEFYLCFPMIALQRAGLSANHQGNQIVNYNPLITNTFPEYIYNG